MSFVLATAADRHGSQALRRFDPRFWTTDFPRPMMAALRTIGTDTVRLECVFYTRGDLTGLIWESADRWDHVVIAYATNKNYAGTTLQFRWRSSNLLPIDQPNGTTLTLEGRDSTGAAHTWYVNLWNYATGTPTDAVVTLNFDALHEGFAPGGALVYAQDLDRIFISAVPTTYLEGDTTLLAAPVDAWGELSAMVMTGPSLVVYTGAHLQPHAFSAATGYDDSYNLTPERLLRNITELGYRRATINHYVGMSHYFRLANSAGVLLATTTGGALNTPCTRWHEDFFSRAKGLGYEVIVATSYELFNAHTPEAWKQRDSTGAPALTGWVPPSTLLSPTSTAAMGYLQAVALAFAQLAATAGLVVRYQVGEPWWWVEATTHKPYFYDASATALYLSETGLTAPVMTSMAGTKTATERAFLDWLGGKLAASTHALKVAVQTAHPGTVTYLLFYAPSVMSTTTPDLPRANWPAGWNAPEWDVLQLEDYDFVIAGNTAASADAAATVTALMGYPPAQQHYFSGFVLNAVDAATLWPRIYDAAVAGRARGVAEVFIWAMPQVIRDGFTVQLPLRPGWMLTIAGVDYTAIVEAFSMSLTMNDRGRASVTLADALPARYAELVAYAADGVTPLFGGLILQRHYEGRTPARATFTAQLDCGDWFTYADWVYTSASYDVDVSLQTVLADLVTTQLSQYGITLDPAQVAGPTLVPFTWANKRASDALRELSDRTGYVVRISAAKVLRMFQPLTVSAPFSLTEPATNCREIAWRDSDRTPYNAVTLLCGPGGLSDVEDEKHYGDGVRRRWLLDAPFVAMIGALSPGSDAAGDDPRGGLPVGIFGVDDMLWTVDLATNEVVQRADEPVLGVGDYWYMSYHAAFPFTVRVTSGATPVVEYSEARPDVRSRPVAEGIATGLLASFQAAPRELQITTDVDGLDPGQALVVDLPTLRGVSGTFLVTSVSMAIALNIVEGTRLWQYHIEASESGLYQGSYLDDWRKIAGVGGGSSGAISGSGGGETTPYRDLVEGDYVNPAADIARVYALDVNGYTQVEMKDSVGRGVRFSSDNVIIAKITEPAGVARGQAVYIAGAAGANSLVRLAKADSIVTMPVIGIVLDAGAENAFTRILAVGTLQGVNTSAFVEGVSLFTSPTVAGGFTDTLPVAPNYAQRVGFVTRSHATQGEILVLTTGVLADPRFHHTTHETGGADEVLFPSGVKERGRTVAMGEWIDFTPVLTASAGTVTIATTYTCKYTLIGKIMILTFFLVITLDATPVAVSLALPAGLVPTDYTANALLESVPGGSIIRTAPSEVTVSFYRNTDATAAWPTGSNTIAGTATFPIA